MVQWTLKEVNGKEEGWGEGRRDAAVEMLRFAQDDRASSREHKHYERAGTKRLFW